MRSTLSWLACLAMCFSVFGCSSFKGYPKSFAKYNESFLAQLEAKIFKGDAAPTANCGKGTLCESYFDCVKQSGGEATACRNKIVGELIAFIDLQYNTFRAELHFENVSSGFISSVTQASLGTAGVLALTTAAKNTLAAISTGFNGVSASYAKAVMFDQTMPAIIAQMDFNRNTLKDKIYENLKKSGDEYTVTRAVSDINELFLAGTLPAAIDSLVKAAQTQSTQVATDKKTALETKKTALMAQAATVPVGKINPLLKRVVEIMGSLIDDKVSNELLSTYKYDKAVGEVPATAKSKDALLYLISLVQSEELYTKVSIAVLSAINS